MDYRQSGVDIDAGNETVRRIKSLARATFTPGVLSEIGSFGGLFKLDRDAYREPVLVSSADGVGYVRISLGFLLVAHSLRLGGNRSECKIDLGLLGGLLGV